MSEDGLCGFLEELLRGAGAILLRHFRQGVAVRRKGPRDPVTVADDETEAWLVARIDERFPGDSILTEEGRSRQRGRGCWIIDPLDGTNNFARGIPHFAVSIARHDGNGLQCGGIYDPCRDELYLARRGSGACCNGRPIGVSACHEAMDSLLATGFAYGRNETPDNNVDLFAGFILAIQDIRRMGSAALDLAWVARGRYEGFWEFDLKPWDTAAGQLLVEEAGGRVTDGEGRPYQPAARLIVASNGSLHATMLERIRLVYPQGTP